MNILILYDKYNVQFVTIFFNVRIINYNKLNKTTMKTLILLLVNNQVKGIVSNLPTCPQWWHTTETIQVPQTDWDNEKVRIDTINKYR